MSQYVTVEQVKDAIGIKGAAFDTNDDATLLSATFRASSFVDSHLDTNRAGYVGFAAGSNSRTAVGSNVRLYHGNGTDTIFIDDAMSISAITVDGTTITTSAFVAEPLNSVPKRYITYVLPFTSVAGLLPSVWNRGTANVSITGYWGLNFIPDDVQQVTLALCILFWQRYQDGVPAPGPHDPDVVGILEGLDAAWHQPYVGGAGVSFGGVPGGGSWGDR